ncbi:MAG: hypothetical protein U0L22_02055 [Bacteroidales bacterium]|nr:hypothetical protein [Bacteroidales bacterium]
MVFDLNEKRIPAIEEEVGQHGIDISVLGSQNASQERDITEIKAELISVAGSLNSMGSRVTALETPKAISTTPFETGETYKGKPVKKVVIPLNNTEQFSIAGAYQDLGVGFGSLPVGIVLECNLVNSTNLQQSGGIHFIFNYAISSGGNIKANASPTFVVDPNAELIIEYIEADPAVSES